MTEIDAPRPWYVGDERGSPGWHLFFALSFAFTALAFAMGEPRDPLRWLAVAGLALTAVVNAVFAAAAIASRRWRRAHGLVDRWEDERAW